MRIRKSTNDQVARKYILRERGDKEPMYHIWPNDRPTDGDGRKSNESKHAISFATVEEAATHLLANPLDQIRMNPGSALINVDVVIETRGDEPDPI